MVNIKTKVNINPSKVNINLTKVYIKTKINIQFFNKKNNY